MGNNKLYRFDTELKELKLIETFKEKLWQYTELEFGTFITTDSGVYELDG